MENISYKLKIAQELNDSIERTKEFIALAHKAQEVDDKNSSCNELNGINRFISCKISAYISTGSQSPRYEQTIIDNDIIVGLMTGGLSIVENILKSKEDELKKILVN